LPSETMIWQPEFTDKTLSRKPGAVHSGYDLYHSLNHRIPLPDLLDAKTRHAAETGEPYAEFDRLYALKDKQFGTLK
ncbi:hypothetical protein OFM95_22935, partial [Escherichia coli]|nr:hypothetical protein [Escherichia coli]MCV5408809.1 hypothetical protein [Escherichia coli]MCV5419624.1 hypothetical protein [Escherichia coli]MCV5425745.1 hypothetical protein [Escherichia coli]MCV5465469.1 hypothetical protein [Escherichia coli]